VCVSNLALPWRREPAPSGKRAPAPGLLAPPGHRGLTGGRVGCRDRECVGRGLRRGCAAVLAPRVLCKALGGCGAYVGTATESKPRRHAPAPCSPLARISAPSLGELSGRGSLLTGRYGLFLTWELLNGGF